MVGLAPSATAAHALAADLGLACENTAKWLYEHDHGRTGLRPGQLVIIDEATLASTATLDRITRIAAATGAKVLLVGDPHQLQSVDAGGAFALLVSRRADVPQLRDIHRFTHQWEKTACLALRSGDAHVIDTYMQHHRISDGQTDDMFDAAYQAWLADLTAGRSSILVADSSAVVQNLNERARAERIIAEGAGDVADGGAASRREVELREHCRASVGDLVITRRNDRTLATTTGTWVKNGDRWLVTRVRRDGSLVVRATEPGPCADVVLPASYVREHLDLGYAITAHRAQGITVDTAHVIVTPSTTRENLYVAMTRGRTTNMAYVALDQPDDSHNPLQTDATARSVLNGVLSNSGAALSGHQTIQAEHEAHGSISRLAAELETIATDSQHGRFVDLLSRAGLTPAQHAGAVRSTAFGPLAAALRRAEAHHHNLETLLPQVVTQHPLDDADDIAAVLRYRIEQKAASSPRGCRLDPRLIAGLIPQPLGQMRAEDRQALDERARLIELRALAVAAEALEWQEPWTRRLGERPHEAAARDAWMAAITTVAAYRDRYGVTSDLPTGVATGTDAQQVDRRRAQDAAHEASRLASAARANATGAVLARCAPVH